MAQSEQGTDGARITAQLFRSALGRYPTGVTVVAADGPNGPVGMTANSFTSVSLDPPLVSWCPARSAERFAVFTRAERFAIHVLSDSQQALAQHFARPLRDTAWDGWQRDESGLPLLPGTVSRFACRLHAVHEAGDHAIVLGRVEGLETGPGTPLIFADGTYGAPQG